MSETTAYQLAIDCPLCEVEGKAGVKVSLVLDGDGAPYECENGHKFDEEPGVEAAAVIEPKNPGKAAQTPAPSAPAARVQVLDDGKETAAPLQAMPQATAQPTTAQAAALLTLSLSESLGGELSLMLSIPEPLAQAVRAEAENLGLPVGEYFQNWLTEALSNYWSSLYH